MTRKEYEHILLGLHFKIHLKDYTKEDEDALQLAVKHSQILSKLQDRPCSACRCHTDSGCSQFCCPFDDVLKDVLKEGS